MFQFDKDISLEDLGGSCFDAAVSSQWSVNGIPNGGYLMALLTAAMLKKSRGGRIVVVTASFLSRLKPGKAEVAVEHFSASTRLDRFEARLIQEGRERIRAMGTFAGEGKGAYESLCEKNPPVLASLGQCVPIPVMPKYTIFEQLDARLDPCCVGWFGGQLSPRSEMKGWIQFKDGRPFDPLSILLMADAFPPPVLASRGMVAWVPTVELTISLFNPPRSPWLRCVFQSDFMENGFVLENGEVWDQEGSIVAASRQVAQFRTG